MASSKRDMNERLAFVRFWVGYMKGHTNREWSEQQADLINSVMRGADSDPEMYAKVKIIVGKG